MSVPSIKGIAFKGVVDDLLALQSCGGVSEAEIASALTPEDRVFLEDGVSPGFWYPMESYDRMLDLLVQKEGQPDAVAYLHARGEGAMKRMLDLGLYRQFETVNEGWGGRVGAVLASIGDAVYNFMSWEFVHPDDAEAAEREFAVEITKAEKLSDHAARTIEGAIAMLGARAAGAPVDVELHRSAPDHIRIEARRR